MVDAGMVDMVDVDMVDMGMVDMADTGGTDVDTGGIIGLGMDGYSHLAAGFILLGVFGITLHLGVGTILGPVVGTILGVIGTIQICGLVFTWHQSLIMLFLLIMIIVTIFTMQYTIVSV